MKKWGWVTSVCAGTLFAAFVWPTLYRYDHLDIGEGRSFPIRINRFNGHAEVLYLNGWKRISPGQDGQVDLQFTSCLLPNLQRLVEKPPLTLRDILIVRLTTERLGASVESLLRLQFGTRKGRKSCLGHTK